MALLCVMGALFAVGGGLRADAAAAPAPGAVSTPFDDTAASSSARQVCAEASVWGWPAVTARSLILPTLLPLTLVIVSGILMARDLWPGRNVDWRPWAWLATLGLGMLAAKFTLIAHNPVTVPFWDQWDAEAAYLYAPFSRCALRWSDFFAAHNEHRIFFTRLLALDLLQANGQWDPRLQQVINALLHTTGALMVAGAGIISARPRRADAVVLACGLCFAAPFGWSNTLFGFQSAFYFLLLFSILALWNLARWRAGTLGWVLGWLSVGCALFSAAGGFVVAIAAAIVMTLNQFETRDRWSRLGIDLLLAGSVVVAGLMLTPHSLPEHLTLRAGTLSDLVRAVGHNLAWPWVDSTFAGAVLYLPTVATAIGIMVRRGRSTLLERFAIGLSAWAMMEAGAIAFGRGAGGALPANRYFDFLSVGVVANWFALLALVERIQNTRPQFIRITTAALAVWFVAQIIGVDRLVVRASVELAQMRPSSVAQAEAIRSFLTTHDLDAFRRLEPIQQLPYPDASRLAALLSDPAIEAILPAPAKPLLRIETAMGSSGFVPEGPGAGVPFDLYAGGVWSIGPRGRRDQGSLQSQPLSIQCAPGTHLEVQVAGYLGRPGLTLSFDEAIGHQQTSVLPIREPKETWVAVAVPCPRGAFSIVARDESTEGWFGFRPPRVVGQWSASAEGLIRSARLLAWLAIGCAALLLRATSLRTETGQRFETDLT